MTVIKLIIIIILLSLTTFITSIVTLLHVAVRINQKKFTKSVYVPLEFDFLFTNFLSLPSRIYLSQNIQLRLMAQSCSFYFQKIKPT